MKRLLRPNRWWILAGCLLVACLALAVWRVPPARSIMRDRFDRIETGMSRADVCQIMGNPEDERGETGVHGRIKTVEFDDAFFGHMPERTLSWGDDSSHVLVVLRNERVALKRYFEAAEPFDNRSWWLQCQTWFIDLYRWIGL